MQNIVVITDNINAKKYNVNLLSPNTGRERDGYMSSGKAFGVGIRAAKKEAKRVAELYNAVIEDNRKQGDK
jgi:hypothetical protein